MVPSLPGAFVSKFSATRSIFQLYKQWMLTCIHPPSPCVCWIYASVTMCHQSEAPLSQFDIPSLAESSPKRAVSTLPPEPTRNIPLLVDSVAWRYSSCQDALHTLSPGFVEFCGLKRRFQPKLLLPTPNNIPTANICLMSFSVCITHP